MTAIADLAWPPARAGDALAAVAAAAGLEPRPRDVGAAPVAGPARQAWLEDAGRWLGLEVEAVDAAYASIDALLVSGPALVDIDGPGGRAVLAVLGGAGRRRRRLVVVDPAGRRVAVAVAAVRDVLCAAAVAPVRAAVDATLAGAGLDGRARDRAAQAMTGARLASAPIAGVTAVRRAIDAAPRLLARDDGLGRRLAATVVAFALAHGLWIAGWWAIGRGVLGGQLDRGWLAAWALLVVSAGIGRQVAGWLGDRLAIDAGALLRRRLLAGTLRADSDGLRRDGVGGALGRVLESSTLDVVGVGGAIGTAFGAVELVAAGAVLAAGAGGLLLVLLLAITVAGLAAAIGRYWRARRIWSGLRLALTHDLVEVMIGHQTRLAQLAASRGHDREDAALARYATAAATMDRSQWRLALTAHGWPIVAAAGLVVPLVSGTDAAALAVALGGILLAQRAVARLTDGATRLVDFAVGWSQIAALVRAGGTAADAAPPGLATAALSPTAPLLTVRGLEYRHRGRSQPVLSGCELVIGRGDHVVLEGASGAGKSTLGAIVGGVRFPDSGLVLAAGMDRPSLGAAGWRRRIAYAPQFHDNHLFSAPLAFNLLLSRSWPPSPGDLEQAFAICQDMGLAGLVARMPAGLFEMVGESGWQLSHGERSRVFVARALLQGSPLVVLDESLAALDAETASLVLACVARRARASMIIAHP